MRTNYLDIRFVLGYVGDVADKLFYPGGVLIRCRGWWMDLD